MAGKKIPPGTCLTKYGFATLAYMVTHTAYAIFAHARDDLYAGNRLADR
jgi:hypothetical protein